MMSDTTFYRHRSGLLGMGVDIALPCESSDVNVVKMVRTITGVPVGVPDWAYDQNLVFQR
jgi:II/X family phage/plasmid replication protein